ncbi:MAG TPA: purine-nucleoside phosphorylase [Anaerolineae bacterium]|nr:purine-nucleoside phosphorylase [Anaerolineae bacterium]HNU03114.1 purine-nucleoside phosphorylase [Anaerolineae bacterium]
METIPTRQHFAEAAAVIRQATALQPKVAIVLGSGLSGLADAVEQAVSLDYRDIPHFPISTIPGHQGRLVLGTLEGQPVAVMQGRTHYYEGYSIHQVTLPIRVLRLLGVETLILTNAAGGLNKNFHTGDLMLIVDHVNMVGMAGINPLRGPNDPELGPRFLDMSKAYDRHLRQLALQVAAAEDIPMHQGVYVGLAGPTFETPAEIRFLRLMGGDTVGMSTTSETVTAHHGGMRVLGISGVSNVAIDQVDSQSEASHEEVLEAGALLTPRMTAVIRGVLRQL